MDDFATGRFVAAEVPGSNFAILRIASSPTPSRRLPFGLLRRMKVLALTPDASLLLQLLANEIDRDLDVVIEPSLRAGLEQLDKAPWSLVFVDSILADHTLDVVEQIATAGHRVVLLARSVSVQLVIDVLRRGAWDLLRFPINSDELRDVIARTKHAAMRPRNSSLPRRKPSSDLTFVGESPEITAARKMAVRLAGSTAPVLIVGERGTGKELLARFLHERGCRREGPFVPVDCAGTLQSELLGQETESSAPAVAHRAGLLELASSGTLFLDEVVDLPLGLQAETLRAIQERRITRVGGQIPVAVDVRLVAATTHTLEDMVAAGQLREGLYDRLAFVVLRLPPLRDRGDDIRLLAEHCVRRGAQEYGWKVKSIADETLPILRNYPWPGNVRELFNVLGHALLTQQGPAILPVHLPAEVRNYAVAARRNGTERRLGRERRARTDPGSRSQPLPPLEALERDHIGRALAATGGQIGRAANLLGIHRNTLRRKLREIQLGAEQHPGGDTATD